MVLIVDLVMQSHEFSRTVRALDIGEGGLQLSFSAEKAERDLLARRFGLVGIRRLVADVCLLRSTDDDERIYLDGHISADFVQTCVVSLRPIEKHVDDFFSVVFASISASTPKRDLFTLEDPDPPNFISDGRLEIGGCIAENLALLLDPYPRDPDAVLPDFMKASADGVDVDLEPIERSLKNLRKMMHNKNS